MEHAVSSADDPGEVEVEQFYVDHDFNKTWRVKAGLFLMPVGLLNEHHEPTNYYGVQRNFVETLIIPTTWREGGLAVKARRRMASTVMSAVTTGLNLPTGISFAATPLYTQCADDGQ